MVIGRRQAHEPAQPLRVRVITCLPGSLRADQQAQARRQAALAQQEREARLLAGRQSSPDGESDEAAEA